MKLAVRWTDVAKGTPLKTIIHVGSNCRRNAAALAEQAQQLGATAISALTPSYFKPADVNSLIDSMQQIAVKAPAMPFYYYDIRVLTGVRLSMPAFLEAAASRIPNLAGIKFTNEDYSSLQSCLATDEARWDILWGIDESLLAALTFGVNGAVGSSCNFAPCVYHRLLAAYRQGDLKTARQEQLKSVHLIQTIAGYGYLPAAKELSDN